MFDENPPTWLVKRLDARPEDTRAADAILIAARTVLRTAPLLVDALGDDDANRRAAILLPIFRALAVVSHAGTWPGQATEIAAAARTAAAALDADIPSGPHAALKRARDDYAIPNNTFTAATDFVSAVHSAADAIADATTSPLAAFSAAFSALKAALKAAADTFDAISLDATFAAISSDARDLESGQDHATVAAIPLWPQRKPNWPQDTLDWITDYWGRLSGPDHLSSKEACKEDWHVWIKWYEAHLDGNKPWLSDLERDIVLIDDDDWKQGPGVVNARIAGLMHSAKSKG